MRKFSVNSNDLSYFRKRGRRDETVMPNTGGYNLKPRRGAKVESRPSSAKGHNKEGKFDPEEAWRNNRTDPTPRSKEGQAAGIQQN
ncbi:hypothetical protein TNCV_1647971 [Trichonephila clavipes]|uniref:Uncharacterized protein n=1 Tax=Trichonephila clavipes TaxID=2585209 RepID=A0A8X6RXG8_TRICX|nr:hypothetical protein TNCV_1647971 [Trichonephila clavipes]